MGAAMGAATASAPRVSEARRIRDPGVPRSSCRASAVVAGSLILSMYLLLNTSGHCFHASMLLGDRCFGSATGFCTSSALGGGGGGVGGEEEEEEAAAADEENEEVHLPRSGGCGGANDDDRRALPVTNAAEEDRDA